MIRMINIKLLLFFVENVLKNHRAVFHPLLFGNFARVDSGELFVVFLAAFVLGGGGVAHAQRVARKRTLWQDLFGVFLRKKLYAFSTFRLTTCVNHFLCHTISR